VDLGEEHEGGENIDVVSLLPPGAVVMDRSKRFEVPVERKQE
jgi:hypothetical protein